MLSRSTDISLVPSAVVVIPVPPVIVTVVPKFLAKLEPVPPPNVIFLEASLSILTAPSVRLNVKVLVAAALLIVAKIPSAPTKLNAESSKSNVSVPVLPLKVISVAPATASTYSLVVREFVPNPERSLYPTGTLIAPVPFGISSNVPLASRILIVLPLISILSTLRLSILLLASVTIAEDAVKVP